MKNLVIPELNSRLTLVMGGGVGTTVLYADSSAAGLFDAVRLGNMSNVKAAVNGGVDVSSADVYGNTLLMQVAVYGKAADVEFLLAHGADAKVINKAEHTALMRVLPDLAKVKLLVEHGANISAATNEGDTALIMAVSIRSAEDMARYLVQKGVDVRASNQRGLDTITVASRARHLNIPGWTLGKRRRPPPSARPGKHCAVGPGCEANWIRGLRAPICCRRSPTTAMIAPSGCWDCSGQTPSRTRLTRRLAG